MNRADQKILIVEDNAVQSLMLKQMVGERHYNIVGVVDRGEEAIAHAVDHKPDLIVMDIFLNGDMTGIEAAEEMRSRGCETPIVFISGNSDPYYARKAKKTDVSTFIFKPVMKDDLLNEIQGFLDKDDDKSRKKSLFKKIAWPFSLFF